MACQEGQGQKNSQGYDGTHSRRGGVGDVMPVILQHLIDTIIVSYYERKVFPCSVEVSGVLDSISLYFTAWQRGIAVTLLDNPQSGGGSNGCVICFDDPRFIHFHADSGIVTDPGFHSVGICNRLVRVHREATGRCETGVESDEYCFDVRPYLITDCTSVQNRAGVEAVGYAILPPLDCRARVRREGGRRDQEPTEVGDL